jgi:hypothetical protein
MSNTVVSISAGIKISNDDRCLLEWNYDKNMHVYFHKRARSTKGQLKNQKHS